MVLKTRGISPKVIADLVVSVAGFLLTKYGASLDPTTSALIGKALGAIAAYLAPHGVAGPVELHPSLTGVVDATLPVVDGIDTAAAGTVTP